MLAVNAAIWALKKRTWTYYVICCDGRKCLWKTCAFLQCEIIRDTIIVTTKEAFHFQLQGRSWLPKSYWLRVAQLRRGRRAMNGDSFHVRFHCPPAVHSRERGPPLHRGFFIGLKKHCWEKTLYNLEHIALRAFVLYGQKKPPTTKFLLYTFCSHAPVCSNCNHWLPSPSGFIYQTSWMTDKHSLSLVRATQCRCQLSAYQYAHTLTSFLCALQWTCCASPIALLPPHTLHWYGDREERVGGWNAKYLSLSSALTSNMTDSPSGSLCTDGLQKGWAALIGSPSVAP